MQHEEQTVDLTQALAAVTSVFGPVVVLPPPAASPVGAVQRSGSQSQAA